ncbi:hypothetical protein IJ843_02515 [bacterium]|nr:hypothetical protein [bacterium]
MGIIGVVAALTLPNLNSLTGDKEKVAKVKKIYSNLEDAYGRATAVYGPIDEWFKNDTTDEQKNKRFGERMTEFMKVSKTCGTSVGCFNQTKPKGSVGASGFDTSVNRADKYDIILADGSSVSFIIFRYEGIITVDIDGPNKGNNEYGKDLFQFFVNYDNDGITPIGTKSDSNELCVSGHMNYCSAWVIMNENLDYLKCYDNLSWSGNHSCK